MGTLIEQQSGRRVQLAARTLIGRTRHADLTLGGHWVSAEHAVIWWTGRAWHLRDLGSRNGTTLNGQRLQPPDAHALTAGAELAFGQAEATWRLEEASPPVAQAFSSDGAARDAIDEVLVLPDEAHAWAVITRQDDDWRVRDEHGERRVIDRDTLIVGRQTWTLRLPAGVEPTVEHGPGLVELAALTLHLRVSLDEESIAVELEHASRTIELAPRAHHEVLLRLAEQLDEDREAGLLESEQGWVDARTLARRLGATRDHLNVQVRRLRTQVGRQGVLDGSEIIERRLVSGQLRLYPLPLVIERR